MTEAAGSHSEEGSAERRAAERYYHIAASAALCVVALAVAYFGAIYLLVKR